ncbi:MAG: hypothetical protein LH614_17515 [Pyrinomonadaceae bacterium]|nr:hypothetical protein [Pyrinomonadaceae bacterium]
MDRIGANVSVVRVEFFYAPISERVSKTINRAREKVLNILCRFSNNLHLTNLNRRFTIYERRNKV